jgi:hypothetical protein
MIEQRIAARRANRRTERGGVMTTYFDKGLGSSKKLVLMKRHEPEDIAEKHIPISDVKPTSDTFTHMDMVPHITDSSLVTATPAWHSKQLPAPVPRVFRRGSGWRHPSLCRSDPGEMDYTHK